MNPLRTTVVLRSRGPVTPEVAWERYADLDRWAQWSPQVQGVEAPVRRIEAGLHGRVLGPLGVSIPFTVTEVGIHQWTWEVALPLGARVRLEHRVLPDPEGAATELRMRGPAPLVLGYAPLAQLALRRLVR